MTVYNKLVRDRIPEIIEKDLGHPPKTRVLDDEEFATELRRKLSEEVAEYQTTPSVEELADILEVIRALTQIHDASTNELEKVRIEKATKRGAFSERIFLIED